MTDYYDQSPFRVRLEWGWRGATRASERGDIVVIVDTLSFSTLAVIAVSRWATLYPCQTQEEAEETARRVGGIAAQKTRTTEPGQFSLSPVSFAQLPKKSVIAVASPNGATCCRLARNAPHVFVGTLINAQAVAQILAHTLHEANGTVTLLACGERWTHDPQDVQNEDGPLRFALEDLLGAGAIASYLPADLSRSPEIEAAIAALHAAKPHLQQTLLTCGSGRELVERGFTKDVHIAAALNGVPSVPKLVNGERFVEW